MEKKELLKGLLMMLKEMKERAEEHMFDANSDNCKTCPSFSICKEFSGIRQTLGSSKYDNEVKFDLLAFVASIKYEHLWLNDFNVADALKDKELTIWEIHNRFDNLLHNFKNWDKLVETLDDNQLSLLRKTIIDVNSKIIDFLISIQNDNTNEMNIIISKLQKPKEEEKSYEDMTKEELIGLLKNQ